MKANFELYANFSEHEFTCSHSGKNAMQHDFMSKLQSLRVAYGKPMRITSGFRDRTHPIEARKSKAGAHTTGQAADIAVDRKEAHQLLKLAMQLGFTGIGIQQKGSGRFLHVDTIEDNAQQPRPTVWSY